MKIRNSFVTNSSSSSYIIAKKTKATEEDIKNAISKKYYENKQKYIDLLEEIITGYDLQESDYIDYQEDDEYDYYATNLVRAYFKKDNIDEEFISYLTKGILNLFFDRRWNSVGELDSWSVVTCEVSNEDDDFFGWLLYDDITIIENELIKVI